MKLNFIHSLLILSLVLISCRTSRELINTNVGIDVIEAFMKSNYDKINSYTATGDIELNLQELKTKLQFSINALKPKSAIIDLFGPFGFDIASVFLKDDSVIIYNAMSNQLIRTYLLSDRLNNSELKLMFKFIYPILFGYFDANSLEADSTISFNSKDKLCLKKYLNETQIDLCYDKSNLFLTEIFYDKKSSSESIGIFFNKFSEFDGIKFPVEIVLTNLKSNETISISFNKIEFNKIQEDLKFNYPEDAEVKE